ncbi:MAG TPA: clan AA aspartic protease [Chthoniobacterales bacterium]
MTGGSGLQPIQTQALADTGVVYLCVPEHVANQLQLEVLYQKEVFTADGRSHLLPYVGPVHVRFENRGCLTGAIVMGDEVLLGAIPMEDMDLVVIPQDRKVAVNPRNPNFAAAPVKGLS